MRINLFIIKCIVLISLFSSCFPTKEGKDMIKYTSEKLERHKSELEKIIKWIEKEQIYPEYRLDIDTSSRIKAINLNERSSKYLDDEKMEAFLLNFYKDFNIYRIMITDEVIYFDFKIRNPNGLVYFLNYTKVTTPKTFTNFKIYSGTNTPKEPTGWLYKFEENWYLESRSSSY